MKKKKKNEEKKAKWRKKNKDKNRKIRSDPVIMTYPVIKPTIVLVHENFFHEIPSRIQNMLQGSIPIAPDNQSGTACRSGSVEFNQFCQWFS